MHENSKVVNPSRFFHIQEFSKNFVIVACIALREVVQFSANCGRRNPFKNFNY